MADARSEHAGGRHRVGDFQVAGCAVVDQREKLEIVQRALWLVTRFAAERFAVLAHRGSILAAAVELVSCEPDRIDIFTARA